MSRLDSADIVSAAIAVGVRVERVVEIPGGDPEKFELRRRGGEREGDTGVFAGLDRDGVEWRIAVVPTRGLGVYYPAAPGLALSEQARFARIEDAREYAGIVRRRRRDLASHDIRIGDPAIEYAGPTR
jgi:hypothetical protein